MAQVWLKQRLGLDRAVTFTVLARSWTSGSGLVTIVLIAHFLSPSQQGYYYTFASLIALQMVFELGFSQVVMQLASHESAHLSIREDGAVAGDEVARARLSSILQIAMRWYSLGAVLFGLVLIPFGLYFFSLHRQPTELVSWKAPWVAAGIASVLAFQIDPLYSFLEGCGFVPHVAHARWLQAVVGSMLGWTSLVTHHGLYAPAAVITGQVLVALLWLSRRRRLLFNLFAYDTLGERVSWRDEIWPFQWRIAVSWISGYFVYQTFNPFLFFFRGPVAAGRMGMSLSFANALMMVAIAWVSTKAAPFGRFIARKQYRRLDALFFRALRQSTSVAALGVVTVWSGTSYLYFTHSRYAHKLLSPLPFALLLTAALLNHIFAAMGTYLRAHKQERLFHISLSIAVAVLLSNYYFAQTSGALGMVAGYLAIIAVIGLGFGTLVFHKYRKIWHADEESVETAWVRAEPASIHELP